MTQSLDLKPDYIVTVKKILQRYLPSNSTAWIFGSRASGKAKRYSDIDIAIDAGQPLSTDVILNLASDFDESDLPYKVDLVDWFAIDDSFRERIKQNRVLIWKGGSLT